MKLIAKLRAIIIQIRKYKNFDANFTNYRELNFNLR